VSDNEELRTPVSLQRVSANDHTCNRGAQPPVGRARHRGDLRARALVGGGLRCLLWVNASPGPRATMGGGSSFWASGLIAWGSTHARGPFVESATNSPTHRRPQRPRRGDRRTRRWCRKRRKMLGTAAAAWASSGRGDVPAAAAVSDQCPRHLFSTDWKKGTYSWTSRTAPTRG